MMQAQKVLLIEGNVGIVNNYVSIVQDLGEDNIWSCIDLYNIKYLDEVYVADFICWNLYLFDVIFI